MDINDYTHIESDFHKQTLASMSDNDITKISKQSMKQFGWRDALLDKCTYSNVYGYSGWDGLKIRKRGFWGTLEEFDDYNISVYNEFILHIVNVICKIIIWIYLVFLRLLVCIFFKFNLIFLVLDFLFPPFCP